MNMPVSMEPSIGLTDREREQLEALANALSDEKALWASGFFAGVAHARLNQSGSLGQMTSVGLAPSVEGETPLAILYASETGNAAELARRIEVQAHGLGLKAVASDLASYKTRLLKDERAVILIASTHGEGEPPEPAKGFFEFINGRKAPKLAGLRFAVLALGDSTYEFFCGAAKSLDDRFEALGAERFHDRVDCDVDYDEPADAWIAQVLEKFRVEKMTQSVIAGVAKSSASVLVNSPSYDKRKPFGAHVIENINITGRGSSKETRHIEFAIDSAALCYKPGDALGILPLNDSGIVGEVLEQTGLTGSESVALKGNNVPLTEALLKNFEITALTPKFLQKWSEFSGAADLGALVKSDDRKALTNYLYENHILDVIKSHPVRGLSAEQLTDALRGLQPRLYSISSSLLAAPDEVHITVSSVRYSLHDVKRMGVASCYLAERVLPDDVVPVYIQKNDHFRLPSDETTPIIMVGAGTGVAPYRSFMQDREVSEASGKSWLLFGERNFTTDFLYQTEWQDWLKDGVLSRMDVAFSRDQAEKKYIQHTMQEQGSDLYSWFEDGAHFYLCGDAEKLAPDVNETLLNIIEVHGGMSRDSAEEYLSTMQRDGRYQRDVY